MQAQNIRSTRCEASCGPLFGQGVRLELEARSVEPLAALGVALGVVTAQCSIGDWT